MPLPPKPQLKRNKFRQQGYSELAKHPGILKSRVGAFYAGSHVIFRGCRLHTELNNMDWMELYLFGITGRHFSQEQIKLFHAIWVYTSYPDARIWNNRVAALAGSVRSTPILGISAALAISEASIYGQNIAKRIGTFLISVEHTLECGGSIEECVMQERKRHHYIAGYGRPLNSGDERNEPILALAKSLSLDQGKYLKVALLLNDYLSSSRWKISINYGAVAAALAIDMGLSAEEYYLFMFPSFLAGMPPCVLDTQSKPEGILFPVACADIIYAGQAKRQWSNAQRIESD
ncbi:MAG: citryl-CoA lyase [Pseudomonadota bacterium]